MTTLLCASLVVILCQTSFGLAVAFVLAVGYGAKGVRK